MGQHAVGANIINMLIMNLQVINSLRPRAGEFLLDPMDVARDGLEAFADR